MSDEFQIHTLQTSDDVLAVSVIGELDAFTANQLRLALAGWDLPISECVVDLSEVTFMDSSGLKVLIECRQPLNERSATVRLVGVKGQVERLLRMTGVDELFRTTDPGTACGVVAAERSRLSRAACEDRAAQPSTGF